MRNEIAESEDIKMDLLCLLSQGFCLNLMEIFEHCMYVIYMYVIISWYIFSIFAKMLVVIQIYHTLRVY